jgi:hypothetical protein
LRAIDGRDVESSSPVGDDEPDVVVKERKMDVGDVGATVHGGIGGRLGQSNQDILDAQMVDPVCAEES